VRLFPAPVEEPVAELRAPAVANAERPQPEPLQSRPGPPLVAANQREKVIFQDGALACSIPLYPPGDGFIARIGFCCQSRVCWAASGAVRLILSVGNPHDREFAIMTLPTVCAAAIFTGAGRKWCRMPDDVTLREVQESDLPIFFEYQLDRDATRMAAFPSRARDAFMAHWAKCLADETAILKTIVFRGEVAGSVVCWEQAGERRVGYWLGKAYWGKGIASAGLSLFLRQMKERPLSAYVAKHNIASIRVLEKCGFAVEREGKFSEAGIEGDEFIMRLGGTP
jgi:RimJ/RimL family protein N-acetyltransferase